MGINRRFGEMESVMLFEGMNVELVSYTYSPYGMLVNATYTTNAALTANARAAIDASSLRYRGYYYDPGTGFYYLQSRYYDPQVGRFISADWPDVLVASPEALTDKNLYAYCDNNPIMRADGGGEFWNYIIGGVLGGVVGGIVAAANGGDAWDTMIGAVIGAALGVVAASGLGWVAQAGVSALISGTADATNQTIDIVQNKKAVSDYNLAQTVTEIGLGGVGSAIGSGLGHLTGKYITKTAVISDVLFDKSLNKAFTAGLRKEVGKSTSALLRQANKFFGQSQVFNNITRGVTSGIGSIFSFWNLMR